MIQRARMPQEMLDMVRRHRMNAQGADNTVSFGASSAGDFRQYAVTADSRA